MNTQPDDNIESKYSLKKVYLKKKVQKRSKNSKQFSKDWSMALAKIPLQLLRRLAEYIMEHKIHDYFACTYNSIGEENRCSECLESSPIHFAALYGDIELLKHIEVKIKNKSPRSCVGNTPLHLAAFEGHLEICKWYINNKGEVNNADNDGWTALHYAVKAGQVEVFNSA